MLLYLKGAVVVSFLKIPPAILTPQKIMKKFLIIDTFNFFHRAYYALPPTLTDSKDRQVNAIYGTASMLLSIFDLISPDYAVAALESKEKVERKKQFEDYKAHRKPMDEELKAQIPLLFELLEGFGIKQVMASGYEADDVIGTLTAQFGEIGQLVICSNDRDLWQLVDDGILVMSPKKGGRDADWIDTRAVKAHFGFGPEYVVDYKALTGDSSDNIPGVKGIGKVTATKLIKAYGHLEEIYANLDEISGSVGKKLSQQREEAFLSYDLATIVTDLDLEVALEDCAFSGLDKGSVRGVLEHFSFYSLVKRLASNGYISDASKDNPSANSQSPSQLNLF
ncbi:hypothetical protein GF360_00735 [candidate division WWE3 bacterium]|nr:hypothetical protein [candidate division WWE3 bacterium]